MTHPLSSHEGIVRIHLTRLKELATKMKGGELTESENAEIAHGFIGLALKIARCFKQTCTGRRDDYASAALFGIVHAVKLAPEKIREYQAAEPEVCPGEHLSRWIKCNIRRMINEFRMKDHTVRVPQRTIHHEAQKGVVLRFNPHGLRPEARRDSKVNEIREILNLAVQDDLDEKIIDLRVEGYNDYEIADMLQVSKSYIHKRRTGIQERYLKLDR